MRLSCCYSPAHEVLYREVFLPSVPGGFEVEATLIDEAGSGDFLSPEFLRCIRRKVGLIEQSLRDHPADLILWSDVDVQFVDISPLSLRQELDRSRCDILFQRESPRLPDVNTGFFVCRSNDPIKLFFELVRCHLNEHPHLNEQMTVNYLLTSLPAEKLPRWGYLPSTYFARTHGWPPPLRLAVYHANYTKGPDAVGQKLSQFAELREILQGGWPSWLFSIIKRLPRKMLNRR